MDHCTICGSSAVGPVNVPSVQFRCCRDCLHTSTPPEMDEGEVLDYYKQKSKWDRFRERYEQTGVIPPVESRYTNRAKYVIDQISENGQRPSEASLLDVGTAAGFFLHELGSSLRDKRGTDLDEAAVRYASKVLQQNAYACGLDDKRVAGDAPYDVVTCFHVLEHVSDPTSFCRQLCSRLREGGLLIIAMPVIQPGFKRISFYREYPPHRNQLSMVDEHIHHFSELSARMLAHSVGLHEVGRRVWEYKKKKYLPEVLLSLRKDSAHAPESIEAATDWQAFRFRASLVRWAMLSKLRHPLRKAA